MRTTEIKARLRQRPFEPFRIEMSGGSCIDVRHPEMACVEGTWIVVTSHDGNDLQETVSYCNPRHVVAVVPLAGADIGSCEASE